MSAKKKIRKKFCTAYAQDMCGWFHIYSGDGRRLLLGQGIDEQDAWNDALAKEQQ